MDTREQLALLNTRCRVAPFNTHLERTASWPLRSTGIEVLQLNLGKRCNMACRHCHVGAGPSRTEIMAQQVIERCYELASHPGITTVDITGGAPEMHPDIRHTLDTFARLGKRLIVRTNLTALTEPSCADMPALYATSGVELVASFPDYRRDRTDRVRGAGTFDRSITALRALCSLGYGRPGSGLTLDLMHNPAGAYLPAPQEALEVEYRKVLRAEHGIEFTRLYCLNNCPIGRYLEYLVQSDNLCDYMTQLESAFNPQAAKAVMCRNTLSVGWDGTLYDCDFNQMLELPVNHGAPSHVNQFDWSQLAGREIVVHNHCYACTAGAGSSCQGTVA